MPDTALGLDAFPINMNVVVVGATGGIGSAMVRALAGHSRVGLIHAGSRSGAVPEGLAQSAKVRPFRYDYSDEAGLAAALQDCARPGPLNLVIVASGVLHAGQALQPEKSWRALSSAALSETYFVNTIGPALVAKHALPLLAGDRRAVFAALSARVGSIGDNRLGGWHAYRASKAALNMLIRCWAVELAQKNPTALCIGLHPGTVDTAMSRPFQAGVAPGSLFTPDFAANALLKLANDLPEDASGRCVAWDGALVPF
jgi:NAD(P)-dependent dehydrogenase (short-subunit alcohol dehydrogenase family)